MGTRKRERQRRGRAAQGWGAGAEGELPLGLEELVRAAAFAAERRTGELPWLTEHLERRVTRPGGEADVSVAMTDALVTTLGECWENGWQPADLVHVVGRRRKAVHRELCSAVVGLDAAGYRDHPGADGGWMAQVDAVAGDGGPLEPARLLEACGRWAGDRGAALLVVLEALGTLLFLPRQPVLCPPPSQWGRVDGGAEAGAGVGGNGHARSGAAAANGAGRAGAADPKVIERVRALLAKAESTEFPEEAEAFTAKAQELIARHAIDLAMVRGAQERDGSGARVRAGGRRVLIDDPYGRAKSLLVAVIARANRCTSVWDRGLSVSTVFGSVHDLDAVELLYTSLLTQATAAMVHAGRAGAGHRSRSFRSSFLMAYANRIGERLQEATDTAVEEARVEHGESVLPVLASQEEAAEEARDEAFPQLGRARPITTRNAAGWFAGRAAADQARLGPDTALPAR